MSGSKPAGGGDPSMEDILASIRRILNEDDAAAAPAREAAVFALDASMMVPGSASRRVEPPAAPAASVAAAHEPRVEPSRVEPPRLEPAREPLREPPRVEPPLPDPARLEPARMEPRLTTSTPETGEPAMAAAPPVQPPPVTAEAPRVAEIPPSWPATLVAPEAAAAAAMSVGSLRRTLEAGRASLAVRSAGPTLDDMVREELRPVLKAWLDANLAAVVERLVRAEIERVVSRGDL